MASEPIRFPSGKLEIEGRLRPGDGDRIAVITHPHSLYGGDMDNPVVRAISDAYLQAGYAALRFNFRGVGRSTGFYDGGLGEQRDLRSAFDFVAGRGYRRIHLAGYSFGAWVAAHVDGPESPIDELVMVSPPVAFMDFGDVGALLHLSMVVTGGADEIAPPDRIEAALPGWRTGVRLDIIPLADHFYTGFMNRLREILEAHIGGSASA